MQSILAVAKEGVSDAIRNCFPSDYRVEACKLKETAFEMLRKRRYDFVFIDIELLSEFTAGNGPKAALQAFWQVHPSIHIIVMCSQERIREAVMAVKAGADNYVTYPVAPEEVKLVTESAHESTIVKSELDYLRDRFWQLDSLEIVQTRSLLMEKVFEKIYSVAPTKSTILLLGETGTGKSILARLIHRQSNRKDGPFISVHCGAIPDTLIESELFGHEKGAFTGAIRRKLGKFEIAHGGTILLDEIGTVTLSAQIKLLQVLQDGTLQRVGGEATVQTDARVIAASNTDLKEMCDEGRFRRDLYYRLNVFPIEIPPLRERKDDIAPLVDVFLKKFNKSSPKEIHGVQEDVIRALQQYPWFGNVRELENLMERAYILERTSMLTAESFPSEIFRYQSASGKFEVDSSGTLSEVRRKGIEEVERRYLKDVLARNQGKINDSANTAGITPRQLHKLLQKYGIRKEDFKSAQFGIEGSH